MKNEPGLDVFDLKGIDKKLNNLLTFDDFDKSFKPKEQKSNKRTDVGLDVVNEQRRNQHLWGSDKMSNNNIPAGGRVEGEIFPYKVHIRNRVINIDAKDSTEACLLGFQKYLNDGADYERNINTARYDIIARREGPVDLTK